METNRTVKERELFLLQGKLMEQQTAMRMAFEDYKDHNGGRDALSRYNLASVDIRKTKLKIANVQSGDLTGMGKPHGALTNYAR